MSRPLRRPQQPPHHRRMLEKIALLQVFLKNEMEIPIVVGYYYSTFLLLLLLFFFFKKKNEEKITEKTIIK